MLKMARELARNGHLLLCWRQTGFNEADVFLNQPHIHNELVDIAARVRRGEQAAKGNRKLSRSLSNHFLDFGSESSPASTRCALLHPAGPLTPGGVFLPRPDSQSE